MKTYAICLAAAAAFAIAFGAIAVGASAQLPEPGDTPIEVGAVEIQGIERVSEQLVRSQLEVQAGQTYNPLAVSRDIRRLFDLGRFAGIQADGRMENGKITVTYIVEELRYIDEVKIIGNKRIKQRQIRGVITWNEGDSFFADGYESERDAVLNLYRSKGFLNSSVDILVDEISASRVRVTYAIDEGSKARITDIEITGNDALSDRKIRKLLDTKKRRLWVVGGRYDETKFEQDLANLVREYKNYGRMEADIVDTSIEPIGDGKKVRVAIDVSEGPEYTVESLDIAQNEVFDDDELLNTVEVVAGEVHNQGQVEDDSTTLETGYRDSGYVDAQVRPQVTLNRDRKTTNVAHQILEGDLKYVREIKITGNSVTRDDVIRRHILLAPGDRFDGAALRASQNQLEATEYFEEPPRVTREPISDDHRFENLLIDLEEGRTGNFNFGTGYSTTEGLGGFVEFRLRNFDITNWPTFSGAGQQFAVAFNIGEQRTEYTLSFTDPEILGYPLSFGFDLYDQTVKYEGGSDYEEHTQGAQLRFAKALSPYVTARSAIRYSSADIDDFTRPFLTPFIQPDIQELNDPGTTIANSWGITRNTLNHFREPTAGAIHRFDAEIAGFGGDNDFLKFEHDSTWYRSLHRDHKWVASFRTRTGVAFPYGDRELVPLSDRFFAGGATTIRGYDTRDIGPKERTFFFFGDEQAIGGEFRVLNSVEVRYKAAEILNLYGFVDSGGVWKTPSDFDLGDIKYSIGIGLGLQIPRFGPLRVDYGFAINPDDDQGSGKLHLSTGIRF